MAQVQLNSQQERAKPKTVIGVQPVKLALVSYADDSGIVYTQLAVIGESNVNLLESRSLGLSQNTTPQGRASKWLADAVLEKMKGKK